MAFTMSDVDVEEQNHNLKPVFSEYFGEINTKNTKQKYKYIKSAVTCSKTVF